MPPYLYIYIRESAFHRVLFVMITVTDGIAKTTINLTLLTVGLKSDLVNKILRFPFILLLLIATKCHFDGINIVI